MAATSRSIVRVLVVGGSFAGLSAVQTLRKSTHVVHVTLVSAKNVFEFCPEMLRSIGQPDRYEPSIRPLGCDDFKFIHGTVLEVGKNEAKLLTHPSNEYEFLRFDFCIWACGIVYPEPITSLFVNSASQRKDMLDKTRADIAQAKRLLVVGGGPRGVEMAALLADICAENSNKQTVLLVTSTRRLLHELSLPARRYAANFLSSKGVKLTFGMRVLNASPREIICKAIGNNEKPVSYKGAEFVFWACARNNRVVASPLIRGKLISEDELNSAGRILVRRTMQLLRHDNIFAIGDCSVVASDKLRESRETFFNSIESGRLAAINVLSLAYAKKSHYASGLLSKYPDDVFPLGMCPQIYFISMGNDAAVVSAASFILTGRIASYFKRLMEHLAFFSLIDSGRFRSTVYMFALRCIYYICVVADKIFGGGLERDSSGAK